MIRVQVDAYTLDRDKALSLLWFCNDNHECEEWAQDTTFTVIRPKKGSSVAVYRVQSSILQEATELLRSKLYEGEFKEDIESCLNK